MPKKSFGQLCKHLHNSVSVYVSMAVAVSVAVSFDINWGKGIGLGSCEKVYVATASPIESE